MGRRGFEWSWSSDNRRKQRMATDSKIKTKALVLKALTRSSINVTTPPPRSCGHRITSSTALISRARPRRAFSLISSSPQRSSTTGIDRRNGDFVVVHRRFSGRGQKTKWITADTLSRVVNDILAEHWDVIQDEVSRSSSKSDLPMFGDSFLSKCSDFANLTLRTL